MIWEKRNRIPYWIWYIMYILHYNSVWTLWGTMGFYILNSIGNVLKGYDQEGIFYFIGFAIGYDGYSFHPLRSLFIWTTCLTLVGSMGRLANKLESIEIDKNKRLITINYHSFYFFNKKINQFSFDDKFIKWYFFEEKKLIHKMGISLNPLRTSDLGFNLKDKLSATIFTATAGWKTEDLREIYNEIESIQNEKQIESNKYNTPQNSDSKLNQKLTTFAFSNHIA